MKCILGVVIVMHVIAFACTQQQNVSRLPKYDFHRTETKNVGKIRPPEENALTAKGSYFSRIVSKICYLVPSTCSIFEPFFPIEQSEARGPKDLIAIISTMLATLLGAILVKLGVLIVLSVISVAIGKLLLIVLTLKTHLFSHKVYPQPIIYEKIYHPHVNTHRDWQPEMGHPFAEEFSPYDEPQYQR